MEANRDCFRFEQIDYESGFLQDSVDATYILTMENSTRREAFMAQLKEFCPTKRVYIVVNKGFKACKKELPQQNPMYDIIDANLQIFSHANEKSYSNVLVLEDDFIFSKEVLNHKIQTHINSFLLDRKSQSVVYTLGCLPAVVSPYNFYTYRVLWGYAMHAMIYSNAFRTSVLEQSKKIQFNDWDMDISKMCLKQMNKFMYKTPLCYQTIPETENKQNWNMNAPVRFMTDKYIQYTNFAETPEPGTGILYFASKLFFAILLILCLVALYYIGVLLRKTTILTRALQKLNLKLKRK